MLLASSALRKYAFINTKLRTRLSKIIPETTFQNIAKAHSLLDAMQILKDTDFADLEAIYARTGDLKMVELELFRREVLIFKEIEKKVVDGVLKKLCQVFASYYEIENLKRILRFWFDKTIRGRDIEDFRHYIFREKINFDLNVDKILAAKDYQEVTDYLVHTPYHAIWQDSLAKVNDQNSLFPVEIALDKFYYQEVLAVLEKLDPKDYHLAKRLIGLEIDLLNINWIMRLKSLYNLPLEQVLSYTVKGGLEVNNETIVKAYDQEKISEIFSKLSQRNKSFALLIKDQPADFNSRLVLIEKILENGLQREVQKMLVGFPFTIGIMLAYFILKRMELKKLLVLLNAKQYGLNAEEIASYL